MRIPYLQKVQETVQRKNESVFAKYYDNNNSNHLDNKSETTFSDLYKNSTLIAYLLQNDWNMKQGDKAILLYHHGIDFITTLLGCLRAGVVAVIVAPPATATTKSLLELTKVIQDVNPSIILTDSQVYELRETDMQNPTSKSRRLWPKNVKFQVTDIQNQQQQQQQQQSHDHFMEPNIEPSDLAFIQYTSGCSSMEGTTKAVMVTHGAMAQPRADRTDFVGVSWYPQYNGIGLVDSLLKPLAQGWTMHLMTPSMFYQNPLSWLNLISETRAAWTLAPDSAYRLVTQDFIQVQASIQEPIPNLDLSCVQYFQFVGEPIRKVTKELFERTFQTYGLQSNNNNNGWFVAAYSVTECIGPVCTLHDYNYTKEPSHHGDSNNNLYDPDFVAVGHRGIFAQDSTSIKIVDPTTGMEKQDGESGEIWINSPNLASGYYYYEQDELTNQEVFSATLQNNTSPETKYFQTGDYGFFFDNYLYVCASKGDIITINNVDNNFYAHDIELMAQQASVTVKPNCVAAFASAASDAIEVLFEIPKDQENEASTVCMAVQSVLSRQIGVSTNVTAIQEGTICKNKKTNKVQRQRNKSHLQDGYHDIISQRHHSEPQMEPTLLQHEGSVHFEDIFNDEGQNAIVTSDNSQNVGDDGGGGGSSSIGDLAVSSTVIRTVSSNQNLSTFLSGFFGPNVSDDQTWGVLNASSTQTVEIINFVSRTTGVQLPPNFTDVFPTVGALKAFVANTQGKPIAVEIPGLYHKRSMNLSWFGMLFFQFLGILALVLVFCSPILPAAIFVKSVPWFLIPFVLPIYMLSYTVLVILMKWIFIGEYRECMVAVPSLAFVRWWFVDRAVHMWEIWVGNYILGSPLMWLTYTLMGAKIHPSAKIETFIREFDLVTIEYGVTVDNDSLLGCSKFATLYNKETKILTFRRINLMENCVVQGHVSPGVQVGRAACVEIRSVVSEGGQVPPNTQARGNPAYLFDSAPTKQMIDTDWQVFGMLKLLWYIIDLYISFACVGVSAYFLFLFISWDFWYRYAPLYLGFLSAVVGMMLSIIVSIALKWILIGKRRPGPCVDTLWRKYTDWIADYHFRVSTGLASDILTNCRLWNLVLMSYGMDIDLTSKVHARNFPPSKVDLIWVSNSYISRSFYSVTTKDGVFRQTTISDSVIGWNSYIGARVQISNASIHPLTYVKDDILRPENDANSIQKVTCLDWILNDFVSIVLLVQIAASSVPVYELWSTGTVAKLTSMNLGMLIPVMSLLVIVQTKMMLIIFWVIEFIAYFGFTPRTEPWSNPWHGSCVTASQVLQTYTLFPMTLGTPIFNLLARLLGTTFENNSNGTGGNLVLFWGMINDFPYIHFGCDGAVVDKQSLITGHFIRYHQRLLGPVHVSGLIHPNTFAMANVTFEGNNEYGPWYCPAVVNNGYGGRQQKYIRMQRSLLGDKDSDGTIIDNDKSDEELQQDNDAGGCWVPTAVV